PTVVGQAAVTEAVTAPPRPTSRFIDVTPAPEANAGAETEPVSSRVLPTGQPTEAPAAPGVPTQTGQAVPVIVATATFTPAPTNTPTLSPTPRPTVPPEGLTGSQDLLAAINGVENVPWTSEQFALGGSEVWRLGVASVAGDGSGDVVVVPVPADMLEELYGNNAASRIAGIEATLALTTFEPELLSRQQVYFGAVLA